MVLKADKGGFNAIQRVRIEISGVVQGVGFRPFVFRLARQLNLCGKVYNTSQGVVIEIEGPGAVNEKFLQKVQQQKPRVAYIQNFQYVYLDPKGYKAFSIQKSRKRVAAHVGISPDLATCPACLQELFDPDNRRYLYPFINCTLCGPRYSIIEKVPYDRAHTSMKRFPMCPACQKEFDDPHDRRFHAQPNACPVCGPQVRLKDTAGRALGDARDAIARAVRALKKGKILAVKGLGGFHLMVDARNDEAVKRLRQRKHREEKPLAVMFPSLPQVRKACCVSTKEKAILESTEAPIILLRKRPRPDIDMAPSLAIQNPYLGVMLPYTPLHHILLRLMQAPLVATSGNLSDEPICIHEGGAFTKLSGIADYFLVHDRHIVHAVDDSLVRLMNGRPVVLRRARGYAPLGIGVPKALPPVIGYGGQMKNTIALSVRKNIFVSPHLGDLESPESLRSFRDTLRSLQTIYASDPQIVAADMHPDYLSTQEALKTSTPVMRVQHHHAHIAACMAENELFQKVLGIAWDGTGFGRDDTIWGGEFFKADYAESRRVAFFQPFGLPGAEQAVRQPKRTALAVLFAVYGEPGATVKRLAPYKAFSEQERKILYQMIQKRINCPMTSSVGRLFDAVASLLDLKHEITHEGQAAMMLEYALSPRRIKRFYPFTVTFHKPYQCWVINWEGLLRGMVRDIGQREQTGIMAKKFHNTLIEMAVTVAKKIRRKKVVLSGGCFQNQYLTERMTERLREEGFDVYRHQQVPPNDGCISLGQAVIAGYSLRRQPRREKKPARDF
jgi:hydrogenase maturation protein HypF